jgi:hypothetical protein
VITVVDVNDLPTATASTSGGNEDTDIAVALGGTDIDGTIATVTVTSLPPASEGVLYLSDGTTPVVAGTPITAAQAASLIFTPAANFNGTVTIPFTVTDNDGGTSAPANEVITVTPVNDAPTAVANSYTTNEDTSVSGNVLTDDTGAGTDFDIDGDSITAVAGTFATAQGGTVTLAANGTFTYTPAANFNGSDSFSYTITDGTLTSHRDGHADGHRRQRPADRDGLDLVRQRRHRHRGERSAAPTSTARLQRSR